MISGTVEGTGESPFTTLAIVVEVVEDVEVVELAGDVTGIVWGTAVLAGAVT